MPKKLIEVALPLEAINAESAREKSIRHGHPSTLHLWWARRPLAACRAVLWASLVDDPASWPEKFPTEEEQNQERQRLFDILGRITIEKDKKGNQKQVVRGLVSWDDIKDEQTINEAQREIARSLAWNRGEEPPKKPEAVRAYIAEHAPPMYDPFAGGGSIPLEAQRLGLEAHASDLNPVAVLINKALIEIPPRFKDCPPVNPDDRQRSQLESWRGAQGLAADVRYYGQWMRDEAFRRIGHLYPQVELPEGGKATVIAWIWARTVKCPNPACGCQMPLVRSFQLANKKGRKIWVEPIVKNKKDGGETKICFEVKTGKGEIPAGTVKRSGAQCVACDTPVSLSYLRSEGKERNISKQLMAIIAEGKRERVYLSPNFNHEFVKIPECNFLIDIELAKISGYLNPPIYGYETIGSMLTDRQRLMIETFGELMPEVKKIILQDSATQEYAESICAYLTLAIGRVQNRSNSFAIWNNTGEKIEQAFSEQGVGMTWDFAEANPFSDSTGSWNGSLEWIPKCIESLPEGKGYATQADAGNILVQNSNFFISTDPPYYSSITYADFSDFFYSTFRKCLKSDFSHLFSTLTTPKEDEIVAAWHRFNGDRNVAGQEFTRKLKKAIELITLHSVSDIPVTIYYAFKEKELDVAKDGFVSAWDSILSVVHESGLQIIGTWPLRTERTTGRKDKKNALATSIVLTCRPRPQDAPKITRRQFLTELKRELPKALKTLQQGNIAPVDLAQASIGPGMAIYSQYAAVLENDGSPMRVRTALQLINQILDEFLTEQEGEFDGDTRWALTWFEQYQFNAGQYGDAETLSKAKNTSVQGMVEAGIVEAKAGKVRLLKREELPTDWTPNTDTRLPDWELMQYLIRELDQNGEMGAAELLSKLGDRGETARDLAYRLYSLCERKNWAQEAIAYNSLVTAWPEITRLASEFQPQSPQQTALEL